MPGPQPFFPKEFWARAGNKSSSGECQLPDRVFDEGIKKNGRSVKSKHTEFK